MLKEGETQAELSHHPEHCVLDVGLVQQIRLNIVGYGHLGVAFSWEIQRTLELWGEEGLRRVFIVIYRQPSTPEIG